MALPAAIAIGGAAGVGIPYLLRAAPAPWDSLGTMSSVHFAVDSVGLDFSWPIFCVTTLLVWLVLRAARNV